MNEADSPFDENALSAEDLEVIRTFEALDTWKTDTTPLNTQPALSSDETDEFDMLMVFATELEEDLETMHQALGYLTEHPTERQYFLPLQRAGHKVRGAAGTMECLVISTIAEHIEDISQQVQQGQLEPASALNVLRYAVEALEHTLAAFEKSGQESTTYLAELERREGALAQTPAQDLAVETPPELATHDTTDTLPHLEPSLLASLSEQSHTTLHVDIQRMAQLTQHSEQLAELRIPLDHAQHQVEASFQELQKIQLRLRRIEHELSNSSTTPSRPDMGHDEHAHSSLIDRILTKASQRSEHSHMRRLKARSRWIKPTTNDTWDELEMERYSEREDLAHALSEALADLAIATTNAHTAYDQMRQLTQKYLNQATIVRTDIQQLRFAPVRILLPGMREVIASWTKGKEQKLDLEVIGEEIELNQDTLVALAAPLLQLVRTCITDTFVNQQTDAPAHRLWLHARNRDNEVTLEVGFSMQVQGGSIEALRRTIERLHGTFSLVRNNAGGVSFHLHLPRSHTVIRCLLVTVGAQQMLVPFSHVQRIDDARAANFDILYTLKELLGEVATTTTEGSQKHHPLEPPQIQPVLLLANRTSRLLVGVKVDEVPGELEVLVKPLPWYMQRPGIMGAALDGTGEMLLVIDLATLTARYTSLSHIQVPGTVHGSIAPAPKRKPSILIADDSTSIRQSLQRILSSRNYTLYEARDGMEALEQLTKQPPDIFLLDMEMPNLNGYDLLNIMQLYPVLANVKVIMLTSRSSEKHRQRTLAMGALAYLTKPCPQDVLLATIDRLLNHNTP